VQVQMRRVVLLIDVLDILFARRQWPLMYPHGIRRWTREQVVVAFRDP
jgi:hypothetical protein